jgi:hypothetical protein
MKKTELLGLCTVLLLAATGMGYAIEISSWTLGMPCVTIWFTFVITISEKFTDHPTTRDNIPTR